MEVKKMNTQEAIEFTESFKDRITSIDIEEGNTESIKTYNNEIDKVINLLQQGEAYRQMWEEFRRIYGEDLMNLESYLWDRTKYGNTWVGINEGMNRLEQKHFPNEATMKATIIFEVEAGNQGQIDWIKDYMVNHIEKEIENTDNFHQLSEGKIKVVIKEAKQDEADNK